MHFLLAVIRLPPNETCPAVIAFGDSIVDTGNNNHLKTAVRCNFPPYGKDFAGRVPTGRFSNGRVPSDMIAEELGIKNLVPAYSGSNLQPQELLTGVCFASGGFGFDPLTPEIVSVLSLADQLKLFKEYISKLKGLVGQERTNFILNKSLFVVVAGSNDIANTHFATRARQLQYNVSAYTDLMANNTAQFLQDIYKLGARRIGVMGAPPVGCVPFQRTLAGGVQRNCAEDSNQAAKLYNSKLSSKVNSLNGKLSNRRIVYIDSYNPLLDLIENPKNYAFEFVKKGCCSTGLIEVAILCTPASPTCPNASQYVFWDSYHPMEAAYKVLITGIILKYINSFF